MGAEGWSGWLWGVTPEHFGWVLLAVAGFWLAARIDWIAGVNRPGGRLAWEAAKAAGLAIALKYAAASVSASLSGLGPVLDLFR